MPRPTVSFYTYNVIYALLTTFVYNFYFLKQVALTTPIIALFGTGIVIFAALFGIQLLLFWGKAVKPLSVLLILTNTIASYFITKYQVALNKAVVSNMFETNFVEATEWFGADFCLWFLGFAVVPVLLVLLVRIKPTRPLNRIKVLIATLCIAGTVVACFLPHKTAVKIYLKEQFNLRYQLVPSSYISTFISLAGRHLKNVPTINTTAGMKQTPYWSTDKQNLIVFVLGETARDANFSLTGYERDTAEPLRPFLNDMTVFKQTEACGIFTRISVPCIFTPYTRTSYSEEAAPYTTNALEILNKNNFNVQWLDNELGCNKVCNNLKTEFTCTSRDCYDTELNDRLNELLPTLTGDNVVVLHQRGTHGPRYDLRTPPEHHIWQPVCKHAEYNKCTQEERVNAFDNSMRFTFFVVADLMKTLSSLTDKYNPVLIYISDHGESIGENGVFGRASDIKNAPPEQTQVPFFIWMPESTRAAFGFDKTCLDEKTKTQQSHDVIFHSLLGLGGIQTNVYDESLDVFAGCHRPKQ